jgi:hypothetical protein
MASQKSGFSANWACLSPLELEITPKLLLPRDTPEPANWSDCRLLTSGKVLATARNTLYFRNPELNVAVPQADHPPKTSSSALGAFLRMKK